MVSTTIRSVYKDVRGVGGGRRLRPSETERVKRADKRIHVPFTGDICMTEKMEIDARPSFSVSGGRIWWKQSAETAETADRWTAIFLFHSLASWGLFYVHISFLSFLSASDFRPAAGFRTIAVSAAEFHLNSFWFISLLLVPMLLLLLLLLLFHISLLLILKSNQSSSDQRNLQSLFVSITPINY